MPMLLMVSGLQYELLLLLQFSAKIKASPSIIDVKCEDDVVRHPLTDHDYLFNAVNN